jgi:hypothetical protein
VCVCVCVCVCARAVGMGRGGRGKKDSRKSTRSDSNLWAREACLGAQTKKLRTIARILVEFLTSLAEPLLVTKTIAVGASVGSAVGAILGMAVGSVIGTSVYCSTTASELANVSFAAVA